MTTIPHVDLIQQLRQSADQSHVGLGKIIKQLAVHVQRFTDDRGGTVWEGTPGWSQGTMGYLRFTTQHPEDGQEQQDLLTSPFDVKLRVQTRNNPMFRRVHPMPGEEWNAQCIKSNAESCYWNAFAMQKAHCHLRNKFPVNPILAQAVFVFDEAPTMNTTLALFNGLSIQNFDLAHESLTDLQIMKWLYCAISLALMLIKEIGFVDAEFFMYLGFALLATPISMFDITTDIVPVKITANRETVFLHGLGHAPGDISQMNVGDILQKHTDLNEFLQQYLLGIAVDIPDDMEDDDGIVNASDVLENGELEINFPLLRAALNYFNVMIHANTSFARMNFLSYLRSVITKEQNRGK